mmetsp:Transcript_20901/g.45453  ORF Transcript_20901/g.45453 Transcript_20901/m.45453 type:complete len:90 (-) Transcript_20901:15-284(-)
MLVITVPSWSDRPPVAPASRLCMCSLLRTPLASTLRRFLHVSASRACDRCARVNVDVCVRRHAWIAEVHSCGWIAEVHGCGWIANVWNL